MTPLSSAIGSYMSPISRTTLRERDLAESGQAPAVLDLRNAQQGGDDGQRLVEPGDRLIRNRPQFLECPRVLTAAFEAYPHAGQWRPQIVGNVVADSGDAHGSEPRSRRACRLR